MNVNGDWDWDSVNDCAHFNFWRDFREIFAGEGIGLLKLVNSAADAWQGLTPKQKKQFERKQYVAEREAELKRVRKGEGVSAVLEQRRNAFRKLALSGQAKYRAEFKKVNLKWDKAEFGADGDQCKGHDAPLFNLKSCFSGVFKLFFGKCRPIQMGRNN
ncbi:uncharacterized protein DMAD_01837 [Drosophila madeirensis]|uniref:HMG box domain-containing protein n=1 Tax=Drosophila madeirensis TaxID=30013 RepID=A0AAU9G2I4_DROMD